MDVEKEKLEGDLRKAIGRAEKGCPTASPLATKILAAIDDFLIAWDRLLLDAGSDGDGSDDESGCLGFPVDFLLGRFSRVVQILRPGNAELRGRILATLRSVETSHCRQVVLDYLPATLSPAAQDDNDGGNDDSINESIASRKQKKEVLSTLKSVLEGDAGSLSQILQSLSLMVESGLMAARDAFRFIVDVLPKVPEIDFHRAIRFLMEHIEDSDDARIAVEAVRTELSLLEKTDISDMAAVAVVFDELQDGDRQGSTFFLDAYMLALEKIVENQNKNLVVNVLDDEKGVDHGGKLSTFDFALLLLNRSGSGVGKRIESVIVDRIYEDLEVLPPLVPSRLADLVGRNNPSEKCQEPAINSLSKIRDRILSSLVDFSLGMLLSPLHPYRTKDSDRIFMVTEGFVLEVFLVLDHSFQLLFLTSMIRITRRLLTQPELPSPNQNGITRVHDTRQKSQPPASQAPLVCSTIYRILGSVVDKKHDCIVQIQDTLFELLKEDSLDFTNAETALRNLCVVISKCTKHVGRSTGETKLLLTCRTLLFSPSRNVALSGNSSSRKRCVKGLVLASMLIQDGNLCDAALKTIWGFVAKLLAPPSNRMVHPEIGLHGIEIARRLHGDPNRSRTAKEIFQCTTQALSNSRVVQYSDDTTTAKDKPDTTLMGNSKIPPFLSPRQDSLKRKFRKMIFSFGSFSRDENALVHPSNWDLSCSWLYNLVDSYLAMGRTAKWIPQAWISAQFEYPLVSVQSNLGNAREQRILEGIKLELAGDESFIEHSACTSTGLEKHLIELVRGIKKLSTRVEVLHYAYCLTFSLLLSMSLSAAVLTSTYDHFKRVLSEERIGEGRDERTEGCSLMQYQLLKMYDLKHKCRSMARFFRAVATRCQGGIRRSPKKRKKGSKGQTHPMGNAEDLSEIDRAPTEIDRILKNIFHSAAYIPSEILWLSLTDSSHDSLVVAAVKSSLQDTNGREKATEIADMRIKILQQLGTKREVVASCSSPRVPLAIHDVEPAVLRERMALCLRIAAFLLHRLGRTRGTKHVDDLHRSLSKLASEYLRLLCSIMVSKMESSRGMKTDIGNLVNSDFTFFFGLFISVLGSHDPLHEAIVLDRDGTTPAVEDFRILANSFQEHLRCADASTATQLLEIMSIFATKLRMNALSVMVDINWKALNTKYLDEEGVSVMDAPVAFTTALQEHGFEDENPLDGSVEGTIVRLGKSWYKTGEKQMYLTQALGRHWGLLALQPRESSRFTDHVDLLLEKMVDFLGDVEGSETSDHSLCRDTAKEVVDDADDDDGDYSPPKERQYHKPSLATSNDLPWLNASSYSHYFDILLRMIVLKTCLFSISDEAARLSALSNSSDHPIRDLENFVCLFGEMMKLLKNKIHLFPKSAIPSIVTTSKCMLIVSTKKLQDFMEWRNLQPIPSPDEIRGGLPDIASTGFLKDLLDVLGIQVIGRLRSLCTVPSSNKLFVEDELRRLFGHGNVSRIKSLGKKVERAFDFLCQKSDAYNLGSVMTHHAEETCNRHSDGANPGSRRLRNGRYGLMSFEESTAEYPPSSRRGEENPGSSMLQTQQVQQIQKKQMEAMDGGSSHEDSVAEESCLSDDDDDDDDSSSGDGDDFGVSGDWGQDSASDDDEDEESELVQRLTVTT